MKLSETVTIGEQSHIMRLNDNKKQYMYKNDNKTIKNPHIMRQKCCIVERKVYNK